MSFSSHSSSSPQTQTQRIHDDCDALDENTQQKVKRQQCLKTYLEFRRVDFGFWHPDLIFKMYDPSNVLIVSFHKYGVDKLLCSKAKYKEKRQKIYIIPRTTIYKYTRKEKFLRIGYFWEKIEEIAKEDYSKISNNCRHKVQKFMMHFFNLNFVKLGFDLYFL